MLTCVRSLEAEAPATLHGVQPGHQRDQGGGEGRRVAPWRFIIPRGVHEYFAQSERIRSPPLTVRLAAYQDGTPPQVVLLLLGAVSAFERLRALLCASSRLEACSTGAEHDRL